MKSEASQTNNLMMHLKAMEKEKQVKPQIEDRKKSLRLKKALMKYKQQITVQRISQSWFLEKTNNSEKSLVKLTKRKIKKAK